MRLSKRHPSSDILTRVNGWNWWAQTNPLGYCAFAAAEMPASLSGFIIHRIWPIP